MGYDSIANVINIIAALLLVAANMTVGESISLHPLIDVSNRDKIVCIKSARMK